MVWFAGVLLKPLLSLTPNGEYMGLNTKTVKVKNSKPDYRNSLTPQERHMENVERGYTTTDYMTRAATAAVKYVELDGKRYKVVTL